MSRPRYLFAAAWFLFGTAGLSAADAKKSVEEVVAAVRPSVVVITAPGREGRSQRLGAGFVVGDGLIATNLHVIGEARPIRVQLADGRRHDVTAVHAFDRGLDLAVVRIDAKGLVPLELADSDKLKQGEQVVALGNPQGLTHSVVAGVVSAVRDIDGRAMIQLAIPLEPGNSGGPLLDLYGRVVGVPTMKSLVTANLGFAVPVNALKPLLAKPSPIPMARWLTLGALDPSEWQPVFGAQWRQRGGRILGEGAGAGFGGRSLCLAQRPVPELPFEVSVTVRLDDESGAAGLVFHADGGDRHYGFYPSGGQLRLVRFEGPDVYSWNILAQIPTPAYRPGAWNTLKVRLEKDHIRGFVNGQQVVDSTESQPWTGGKVGLAKFRDTRAEFKNFEVAREIAASGPPAAVAARVLPRVRDIAPDAPPKPELVEALQADGPDGVAVLREQARRLEQQAGRLRELAVAVHQKRVQTELARMLQGKDEETDLLHAALLVARLDNDDLDVGAYRKEVERMARELAAAFPKDADEKAKLAALNKYLFAERGYHGSRSDYYQRSNSYLNAVIDDREGIPITLSVLYMELGRRVGLKLVGIGLPGHFVVRHVPAQGEPQLIDVYEGGKVMTREEANSRVQALAGQPLRDEHLAAVSKRAILLRMLQNLLGIARGERNAKGMLPYLDTILMIAPDDAEQHWLRAMVRLQADDRQGALADVDWLLEKRPDNLDLERVREMRRLLTRPGR
jgi:regulator of sirC expression with transglutaminase-like and TPR domain